MLRPTREQLGLLSPFERFAFEVSDVVNRNDVLKRAAHTFLRTAGASWVYHCTKHLLHVEGAEHLAQLAPDRGVVIASNHRSFFDLYVIASVLLRRTDWVRGMYFPVRSTYFYERPDGIVVNAIMSAMAMYPPIMRDGEKRDFNSYSVDYLADVLQRPGTVVGIHPEGTRNKTDDPYTLQPARQGIGQIVHRARPIVIPTFIVGLSNDLPRQVRGNFDGTGSPITLVIGKPVDLEKHYGEPARLSTYKRVADHIRDEIMVLGDQDRALRARLGMPSMDPSAVVPVREARPKREAA